MGVRRLRELHLFAGAGGGILGGMLIGHTPVCAVEIDPYCRKVLQARQDDGSLPPFPILEDVREFDGKPWRGKVDVVCGGFPCQPWSSAGKKLGTADPRHLWPEMARIIKEVRPTYVFTENVSLSAFEEPWRDLRGLGYRVPPAVCVSASDVGAPHLRKRWWLLAADDWHAEGQPETNKPSFCDGSRAQCLGNGAEWVSASDPIGGGGRSPRQNVESQKPERSFARYHGETGQVAEKANDCNPNRDRESTSPVDEETPRLSGIGDPGWWEIEPDVGRVANGLAAQVDRTNRLKAIGNGQVPLCAATAWRLLMELSP